MKSEQFKASLHEDKKKHLEGKQAYEEMLRKAGIDPKTGEAVKSKDITPPAPKGLDLMDIRALNDVPDEDIKDVMEYAEFKSISITEAKKTPVIKTLLKSKAEERATEAATATQHTKRSSGGQSKEEKLLSNLEKGIVPDTEEDNAKLAEAQFAQLLKSKSR